MKQCPYCRHALQRWGKTAAGTLRYFCPTCRRSLTKKARQDLHERHLRYELDLWLGGKDSLGEIAERYHTTRQTLWKQLRPLFTLAFEPLIPREPLKLLILDATYIHRNRLCALIAIDEQDRIFWRFAKYESSFTWKDFLCQFKEPEVIVMDGQKGLIAAAQGIWPRVRIQRCQFHLIAFVLHYLGRRPKDDAGRALLNILYTLKDAKNPIARDEWIQSYKKWELRYEHLLIGRNRLGRYEYPRLRSVRFIVRKALPHLFTFLDFPGTPNTTNLVEGWVNSAVAEALRFHRGLHEYEKKTLVAVVLSHLRRSRTAEDSTAMPVVPKRRKRFWYRKRRRVEI